MKHCLLFILAIFLSVDMNASDESLPSKTYVVQDMRCHVLYKTTDGVLFDSIASLRPDPMPIQISDVFSVPKVGLMALWFAGSYKEGYDHSWGTLTSSDNGHSWTQHVRLFAGRT